MKRKIRVVQHTKTKSKIGLDDKSLVGQIEVELCPKIGNFARCVLPAGHSGVHQNPQEEFIQFDSRLSK